MTAWPLLVLCMPTFICRWARALVWLGLLCTAGCKSEFFIDKGQLENIQGVTFVIKSPHLFIKKAFKLHDTSLSPAQLMQISDAMPAIAAFTHAMLRDPNDVGTPFILPIHVRALRPLMHQPSQTTLFVNTLQNWKVRPSDIEFTIDYFYSNAKGEFVNFRDNYAFELTPAGWLFSNHPRPQAEGLLSCTASAKGWRVCDTDKP